MQDSTDWDHDDAEGDDTKGMAIAISLVVVALIGILAGVVLAITGSDDDQGHLVIELPDGPSSELGSGEPIGADSPLVGLTEAEVRERYPLVRVVEIDGQMKPMTMDLLVGRVNLTVVDGKVAGAFVEGCEDAGDLSGEIEWALDACDMSDSDAPDATGTVAASPDGDAGRLVLRSQDSALDGIVLHPVDDQPAVRDAKGNPMDIGDLQVDDEVSVWTMGPCEAGDPPQCLIAAITVVKGP